MFLITNGDHFPVTRQKKNKQHNNYTCSMFISLTSAKTSYIKTYLRNLHDIIL